jgi:hypothetical protein
MPNGISKFNFGEFTYNPKKSTLTPSKSMENRMARLANRASRQRSPPKKKSSPPKKRKSPFRPKGRVMYVHTVNQNFARMARQANERYKSLKGLTSLR